MKRTVLLAAALLMGAVTHALAADHGQHGHHGHAQGEMTESRHKVRGIYLGYDAETHRISVAHEEIPGVMRAMRMNLRLAEGDAAPGLAEGERIRFTMMGKVEEGMTWYADSIEALPTDTELELPENLREMIGH
ncbi:copper-binding protein [Halomonas sp. PGE1]|jgi:Cu/Ag efflux protein CusF|uniref:copper-binding protein n=1 Tax=Halomonas sp. PGE1 TaxID=2730360 RepID=UPI001475B8F3|nr:copper-binding protein [Halomonas sp. PGE1]QJQ97537.1 copper-binding protein [Halomonas sp. PGE1]